MSVPRRSWVGDEWFCVTGPVSRETPPPPDVAAGVFSHALPTAIRFADLLAVDGVTRGLIGPREVPRLWDRHLVNCALFAGAIPDGVDLCDIGSGAGLPGIVLALVRPDLRVTLVEPLLRRTTFLEEAVETLGLENVDVVRARAEDLHGERDFAAVTSRAVAPLDRLLAWSLPLVRPGGEVVAMKGASVDDEIRAAAQTLKRLGGGEVRVEQFGTGFVERPTTVVRVRALRSSALGSTGVDHSSSSRHGRQRGRKR